MCWNERGAPLYHWVRDRSLAVFVHGQTAVQSKRPGVNAWLCCLIGSLAVGLGHFSQEVLRFQQIATWWWVGPTGREGSWTADYEGGACDTNDLWNSEKLATELYSLECDSVLFFTRSPSFLQDPHQVCILVLIARWLAALYLFSCRLSSIRFLSFLGSLQLIWAWWSTTVPGSMVPLRCSTATVFFSLSFCYNFGSRLAWLRTAVP